MTKVAERRGMRPGNLARAIRASSCPACSDYKDALVVNPCGDQIRVRFGGDEGADDPVWGRRSATMIPPMTTELVKSAFADVGPDEYSVLVDVNGTATLVHVADVGETILVPVPASVC